LAWSVSYDPRALKELEKLDRIAQKRIVNFLRDRIEGRRNPRELGKALTGGEIRLWRYRVGDYRMICQISDASQMVLILRIAHRKEAYRY